MKLNKNKLYIVVSSIALLVVLIIQVAWIVETAKIKEAIFNEKANMVITKTADLLSEDKETCRSMNQCVGENEILLVDSLIETNMEFYSFPIDYSFEIACDKEVEYCSNAADKSNAYNKTVQDEVTNNGLELVLYLPDKEQFIMAEMGPLFITSIILILIVFLLFWRTVRSLARERQISKDTKELFNNMAHEFKTPLTNISLAGKMLLKQKDQPSQEKIAHYSTIILDENEKLKREVEKGLRLTELERGETALRKVAFDLHGLINDVVNCMQLQIEGKGGKFNLKLNAAKTTVFADKTHICNKLSNLIDNAIKYSPESPDVTIETRDKGDSIEIKVADKGIGIEKQFREKVFDRFFRVPTGNVHNVKGFGIGLAYVRMIVELHKGQIVLNSQKGKGTSFTITLPRNEQ